MNGRFASAGWAHPFHTESELHRTIQINLFGYSENDSLESESIYIFAFYDHDVRDELKDINFRTESEKIELSVKPDKINTDQKWRSADNAFFAFQSGIQETQKMNTTVYLNEEGNILYIEAIGD